MKDDIGDVVYMVHDFNVTVIVLIRSGGWSGNRVTVSAVSVVQAGILDYHPSILPKN